MSFVGNGLRRFLNMGLSRLENWWRISDFLLSGRKQVVSDREESTAEGRSSQRNLSGATGLGRRSFTTARNCEEPPLCARFARARKRATVAQKKILRNSQNYVVRIELAPGAPGQLAIARLSRR